MAVGHIGLVVYIVNEKDVASGGGAGNGNGNSNNNSNPSGLRHWQSL